MGLMRHHYVPQFLLRAWADEARDGKLEAFRFDLPELKHARIAPSGTAYEDDLYALTRERVAGMEKQAVEEELLKRVDNAAAIVAQKFATSGLKALTFEERCDWTRFLVSMRLRQPAMIELLRTTAAEGLRQSLASKPEEYEPYARVGDPPTLEVWAEQNFPGVIENFGMSFFHELVNSWDVGSKILTMKWWLWDFTKDCGVELLLCDHPAIFTHGIDHPDLMVALPLSPTRAFMATRSESGARAVRAQKPRILCQRLNESLLNQVTTRVYATDAAPRRFLENRFHLIRERLIQTAQK